MDRKHSSPLSSSNDDAEARTKQYDRKSRKKAKQEALQSSSVFRGVSRHRSHASLTSSQYTISGFSVLLVLCGAISYLFHGNYS